jgi:hypothetical protein
MMPPFPPSPYQPYGGFSPVRLEGWLVRRGLPNTSISLSLLPACTVRRPVRLRPSLSIRTIAWKAQVRLCARYRRLIARGKKTPVVTTAIARELAAFLWAIGQQVAPQIGVTPAS